VSPPPPPPPPPPPRRPPWRTRRPITRNKTLVILCIVLSII
jgi:hypothetical protein